MPTPNAPISIVPDSPESVEWGNRKNTKTVLATLALAIGISIWANNTLAQSTSQTAPSTPASASADKGVGYGQMTKDGREFGKLTEEEVKRLSDPEYDAYQEWKIAQKKATVIAKQEKWKELDATVIAKQEKWKELDATGNKEDESNIRKQATLIATYSSYIDTFNKLHALKWRVGFNENIYNQMKWELKAILLSGKPPEILTKLEPLRAILTA